MRCGVRAGLGSRSDVVECGLSRGAHWMGLGLVTGLVVAWDEGMAECRLWPLAMFWRNIAAFFKVENQWGRRRRGEHRLEVEKE